MFGLERDHASAEFTHRNKNLLSSYVLKKSMIVLGYGPELFRAMSL